MRYLTALCAPFALTLMAACAVSPAVDNTPGDVPVMGPDPDLATQKDLSDIVPDESNGRPAEPTRMGPHRTIAGLGDPGHPGLWLETTLVKAKGPGHIRLASGGGLVAVTLLPIAGEATAGSRASLEAMRQLGAPLTDLVELTVTVGG
ncbi:MAG: hypothetical protein ACI8R4_003638 [Paracoccaceae bacterium]|jgi:hypothetical protein